MNRENYQSELINQSGNKVQEEKGRFVVGVREGIFQSKSTLFQLRKRQTKANEKKTVDDPMHCMGSHDSHAMMGSLTTIPIP